MGPVNAAYSKLLLLNESVKTDDRISAYWPDFGAGAKGKVTVKEMLEHSGGVAWLDPEYQPTAEMTLTENLPMLARHIAGQPHNQGGKTTRAYHAITVG